MEDSYIVYGLKLLGSEMLTCLLGFEMLTCIAQSMNLSRVLQPEDPAITELSKVANLGPLDLLRERDGRKIIATRDREYLFVKEGDLVECAKTTAADVTKFLSGHAESPRDIKFYPYPPSETFFRDCLLELDQVNQSKSPTTPSLERFDDILAVICPLPTQQYPSQTHEPRPLPGVEDCLRRVFADFQRSQPDLLHRLERAGVTWGERIPLPDLAPAKLVNGNRYRYAKSNVIMFFLYHYLNLADPKILRRSLYQAIGFRRKALLAHLLGLHGAENICSQHRQGSIDTFGVMPLSLLDLALQGHAYDIALTLIQTKASKVNKAAGAVALESNESEFVSSTIDGFIISTITALWITNRGSPCRREAEGWIEAVFIAMVEAGLDTSLFSTASFERAISDLSFNKETTLLEFLYYEGRKEPIYHKLFTILLDNGESPTPLVAELMTLDLARLQSSPKELASYKRALLSTGIAPEKITFLSNPTGFNPTSKSDFALLWAELARNGKEAALLKKTHARNYQNIPIATIEAYRLLKKRAKAALATAPFSELAEAEQALMRQAFNHLVASYNAIVDGHDSLKLLRIFSEELRLRAQENSRNHPSKALSRFASLWHPRGLWSEDSIHHNLQFTSDTQRKTFWKITRQHFIEAYQRVEKDLKARRFYELHQVDALHGTKSSNLPSMTRTGMLLSAGKLMEKSSSEHPYTGTLAFSGEFCGSHNPNGGCNAKRISCERFTHNWTHYRDPKRYPNCKKQRFLWLAATRLLVSEFYARRNQGGESLQNMQYSLDSAMTWLNPKFVARQIDKVRIPLSIQRVRLCETEEVARKALQPLQTTLQAAVKDGTVAQAVQKTVDRLLNLMIQPLPKGAHYNPEEVELIRHPFPVVLASTTEDPVYIESVGTQEFFLQDERVLGRDMQIAFCPRENLDQARGIFGKLGMTVFDLDDARLLEMQQMTSGSAKLDLEKSIKGLRVSGREANQIRVSYHLTRILKQYTKPYPSAPTFQQDGQTLPLQNPYYGGSATTHEEYATAVKAGRALPRDIHGLMHATRTAIAARLFSNAAQRKGKEKSRTVKLAIAGACHDIMRQDEGPDRWDSKSGEFAATYVRRHLGYSKEKAEEVRFAIAEKDPESGTFTSSEQAHLHYADQLEILRVLMGMHTREAPTQQHREHAIASFRRDDLRNSKLFSEKEITQLLVEWSYLIRITDTQAIKLALERSQVDYYTTILQMIDKLKLKMVKKLLKHEIRFSRKTITASSVEIRPLTEKLINQMQTIIEGAGFAAGCSYENG